MLTDDNIEEDILMEEKLYYFTSEEDAPFNMDELPYKRTLKDDLLLVHLANEFGDRFSPESQLGKLQDLLAKKHEEDNWKILE